MKKIVRLTESDLVHLVNRVIKEQQKESGDYGDFDYYGKIVVPQMKQAGFKMVDDGKLMGKEKCPYYCCKYFCYPDHSNGINLSLQCGDGNDPYNGAWEITVWYKGNKGIKNFTPGKQGAQQAVDYAIKLKNQLYSKGLPT